MRYKSDLKDIGQWASDNSWGEIVGNATQGMRSFKTRRLGVEYRLNVYMTTGTIAISTKGGEQFNRPKLTGEQVKQIFEYPQAELEGYEPH